MKTFKTAVAVLCCFVTAALLCGCTATQPLPKETTLDLSDYEISFEDNFDTLARSAWRVGIGENPIRRGAYYVDDPDIIFAEDGNLVIRTKYKDGAYGEGWYTSWVDTCSTAREGQTASDDYEGFSQTGGYFEARCIPPKVLGIWSAFWLMPDTGELGMTSDDIPGTGADGVEIDVMESPWCFTRPKNINVHVVHGEGYAPGATKSDKSPCFKIPDMYTAFHTYGVLITDDEYVFYIDGKETWRSRHVVDGKELGVSHANQYPILSVEVSGENGVASPQWCGDPAKNNKDKNYDFVIDYVKVYRQKA